MLTSFEFCGILKKERSCQKRTAEDFFFLPQKRFFALKGKKMFLREATNETQRTGESASGAAEAGARQRKRTPPHKDDGAVRQTSNYTKCFVLFAWGQTEQRILKYGKAPNHTKQPTFCKQKPQAPTTMPKKQHIPLLWLGLEASAVNCFLPRAPVSAHLCKNFRFCS